MNNIKIEEDFEQLYNSNMKTKRINKSRNNEQATKSKIMQRVPKETAKEQIFFESDDSDLSIIDANGSTNKKVEPEDDEYEQQKQSYSVLKKIFCKKSFLSLTSDLNDKHKIPFLSSCYYSPVSEIDFDIYINSLNKSRIYSAMLVDQFGKIIYSDKMGHQLFEGSLNNFQKIHIQDLFLSSQAPEIKQVFRQMMIDAQAVIIKLLIYSKNAKRRYSRVKFPECIDDKDIFYRFLKCLTSRIRPIQITFRNYHIFQGFWNEDLVNNELPLKCFLFETRLAKSLPNLKTLRLADDTVIQKFIASNKKKVELHEIRQQHVKIEAKESKSYAETDKVFIKVEEQPKLLEESDFDQKKKEVAKLIQGSKVKQQDVPMKRNAKRTKLGVHTRSHQ